MGGVIGIQATVNISLALNIPVQTLSSYARPAGTAQDRPTLSPSGKECRAADCCGSGTLTSSRPYPRETTSNQRGHNPFTTFSSGTISQAVFAAMGRSLVICGFPTGGRYVWFPLVPHWDVLSIAWKCSKYRFWVCSNYFF